MREGCLPDCLPPFSDLLRLLLRPPPEIKPVSLPFFEAGRGGGGAGSQTSEGGGNRTRKEGNGKSSCSRLHTVAEACNFKSTPLRKWNSFFSDMDGGGGRPGGKKRQKWGSIVQETLERSFLPPPFLSCPPAKKGRGKLILPPPFFAPPPPDTYYTPSLETHTPLFC